MTTYVCPAVEHRVQRRVECAEGCGKKLIRTRTFEQTINPWNKNAAGEVKSRSEILEELKEEAADWQPKATCPKCAKRIEDAKPKPPADILVLMPDAGGSPMLHRSTVIHAAGTVAAAREHAAEKLRGDIAVLQARLAAINEWTFHCFPRKCKHGDEPCFPEVAASVEAVA